VKRLRYAAIAPAGLLIAGVSLLSACGTQVAAQDMLPQVVKSSSASGQGSLTEIGKPLIVSMSPTPTRTASRKPAPRRSPSARKTTTAASSPSPSGSAGSSTQPDLSAAPDPSGQTVPIGNLPGWNQVFYDDFQGESVSTGQFSGCSSNPYTCSDLPSATISKWADYPDGWLDTAGNCEYEPSQTLSISGGILNMFIHTSSSGTCMTAAPIAKLPDPVDSSNGQLYGMYSVRMRSDPVPGYLVAFLLWPDNGDWPEDGEIDFPNGDLDSSMDAFMHHEGATSGSDQDYYLTNTTLADWHTYTIEWTPNYVKFLIDGQVIGDSTDASEIPDTPMHWVMQTESDLNAPQPAASAQGNLQIAWAAVWSYDPSTS
jgi:Glycosyl hydrolases family 16